MAPWLTTTCARERRISAEHTSAPCRGSDLRSLTEKMTVKSQRLSSRTVLIAVLLAALIAPIWLVRYLPLQDYPDLLMQVAILSNWTNPTLSLDQIYRLRPALPPRLASLSVIFLFSQVVRPEIAGKLMISLYLILFPLSVFYLFRAIQSKASSAEFIGFLLAYNFWFFQGSFDYLLGMALVCFAVGYVIRHWTEVNWRQLLWLIVLSVLCYLSHIMAYVVFAMVVGLLWLVTPDRRWRRVRLVAAAAVPGLVLLAAHVVLSGENVGSVQLTTSVPNKALAYVMPLLTFFRFEPYATPLPVTLANIVFWTVSGVLLLGSLERKEPVQARQLVVVAGILFLVILVSPVRVGRLWRFDDRLVLPTYLLLAAGLRFRPRTLRRDLLYAALVISVSGLQLVQMRGPIAQLAEFNSVVLSWTAQDEAIVGFTVRDYPIRPGCHDDPGDAYSVAILPTILFPVHHLLETNRFDYGSLYTVGLLVRRESTVRSDLVLHDVMRSELSDYLQRVRYQVSGHYDLIEVFGCASDIDVLAAAFPEYDTVFRRDNAALLALRR